MLIDRLLSSLTTLAESSVIHPDLAEAARVSRILLTSLVEKHHVCIGEASNALITAIHRKED